MCIGCRERRAPDAMVRLSIGADGHTVAERHAPGRGAWVCAVTSVCFDRAVVKGALARALRAPVSSDDAAATRAAVFVDPQPDVRDYGVAPASRRGHADNERLNPQRGRKDPAARAGEGTRAYQQRGPRPLSRARHRGKEPFLEHRGGASRPCAPSGRARWACARAPTRRARQSQEADQEGGRGGRRRRRARCGGRRRSARDRRGSACRRRSAASSGRARSGRDRHRTRPSSAQPTGSRRAARGRASSSARRAPDLRWRPRPPCPPHASRRRRLPSRRALPRPAPAPAARATPPPPPRPPLSSTGRPIPPPPRPVSPSGRPIPPPPGRTPAAGAYSARPGAGPRAAGGGRPSLGGPRPTGGPGGGRGPGTGFGGRGPGGPPSGPPPGGGGGRPSSQRRAPARVAASAAEIWRSSSRSS